MNAKTMVRMVVVALVAAMLGGAYLIVQKNGPRGPAAPQSTGFYH